MEPLRVLAISGSLRAESYNRKALQLGEKIAEGLGARVTKIDLKSLDLPIYDGDIETQGLPESVKTLKGAVEDADMLLIASPEYNYSIPGGLKNAIDWLSRQGNSLDGKTAVIFGASNGVHGTIRMQPDLRKVLGALNVSISPQPQVHIGNAQDAFHSDGSLKDRKTHERLAALIEKTLALARQLKQ